ncbi:hypothetical protein Y013_18080 [Rhodococcus pyridinivorans SB3094]|uniref:YhcG PDDEXK nuclease domain-containing protein n=1 Tax=Rhodococcus pyridinivorans SB3094 TaxID=1435356 RepID=V9XK90_9NOCA|nr:hypothetical protein Y013_18080 [Rhodococcus pyridinivorans SB3094]
MVASRSDSSDRRAVTSPCRCRAVEFSGPSSSTGLRPRTATRPRPVHLRFPRSRRAGRGTRTRSEPEYAGKLGFYVSWVDENLRVADRHAPTIGILLCAGRNDHVVRYSLAGTTAPLAVANYTYDTLPEPIRELVPTDSELADAVDATWDELTTDRTDGDNLQT